MCGFVGFVGEGDRNVLVRMADSIFHRGPDGAGYDCDERNRVYLGHRRLAVLDIAGGVQPMWNEDGTVGIVFNGEIYNHGELRRELVAAGHHFASTHSDTEVLVHGYEQWGKGLLDRIKGMFAFAITDTRRRQIFLARDHFGKKPLFYAQTRSGVAFGSEIAALLRHPAVPDEPDRLGLMKFFAYSLFPAPHTPYRAIRKLPGGHCLTFDIDSGSVEIQRYWAFRMAPVEIVPANAEARWAEELRDLLDKAVARRLEADVPLGILLSGGIDSGAVLALAARHVPAERLKCFSMGFTEASFDESAPAALMAAHVGAPHHLTRCDLGVAMAESADLLARLDEPMGDSSILPTHLVSRFTREQVTVALSGDGGDELFAGYDPFDALRPTSLYSRMVPAPLHRLLVRMAGHMPKSDRNMSLDFKVNRWLRGAGSAPALWSPLWMGALAPAEIGALFGCKVDEEELYSEALALWQDSGSAALTDRVLEYFTNIYLQDGILVKSDRASMLVSLELRSPFLDLDVAEFARRIPWHFKLKGGERKALLRRAVGDLLPPQIMARPKKGFGIPLSSWLRSMAPPPTGGVPLIDEDWLTARWRDHQAKQGDYRHALWCWLALNRHFSNKAGFDGRQ